MSKIFRYIKKELFSNTLSLLGLAIGITSSVLILLWISDESSWDRFHTDYKNKYRIVGDESALCPIPLGQEAKETLPEVIDSVSLQRIGQIIIRHDTDSFYEDQYFLAGESFFKVLNFPLSYGDSSNCLQDKNSVVITENLAIKVFGRINVLGETLTIRRQDYRITAIAKNPPHNSHMNFEILIPIDNMRDWWDSGPEVWNSGVSYGFSYVHLKEGSDPELLKDKINNILLKHNKEEDDLRMLQPVSSIRLGKDLKWDISQHGSSAQVYLFALAAFLIIVIISINFINLNISNAIKRTREIALRKTCGASKFLIFKRFLSEYLLLSIAGLLLGLILAQLFLPWFNGITAKNLSFHVFQLTPVHFICLIIVLALSLLSTVYPTYVSSKSKIALLLKENDTPMNWSGRIRTGLVLFQFVLAISLIIVFISIQKQISYIQNRDLGYSPEKLMYVRTNYYTRSKIDVIKNELMKENGISSATTIDRLLLEPGSSTLLSNWPGKQTEDKPMMQLRLVDHDFMETNQMKLLQGNFFRPDSRTDFTEAVLNETAVKIMGLENPIGQDIQLMLPNSDKIKIIGVVKDFHFVSLHNTIEPMVLFNSPSNNSYILIKTKDIDPALIIGRVKNLWNEYSPSYPLDYGFMDEKVRDLYSSDVMSLNIIQYFAFIGIVLACMGLLGLVIHTILSKTKEIGIRKVLGATMMDIVLWLNRKFAKNVLIANIIAWPIAYYAVNRWLESFAYRTEITLRIYILAGLFACLIALLTISYHSLKAASMNPVDAIRSE